MSPQTVDVIHLLFESALALGALLGPSIAFLNYRYVRDVAVKLDTVEIRVDGRLTELIAAKDEMIAAKTQLVDAAEARTVIALRQR